MIIFRYTERCFMFSLSIVTVAGNFGCKALVWVFHTCSKFFFVCILLLLLLFFIFICNKRFPPSYPPVVTLLPLTHCLLDHLLMLGHLTYFGMDVLGSADVGTDSRTLSYVHHI